MNTIDRMANAGRIYTFKIMNAKSDTNWNDLPESARELYRNVVIGALREIRDDPTVWSKIDLK